MRRALVIGGAQGDLLGVHNDVNTMTTLLAKRGFAVDTRTDGDATRAGILDGLERLIMDSTVDDAVAIYYTGHGGLARVLAPNGKPLPELQFIGPTDYDESHPGDFRGITAIELSVLVDRLTKRTRNVTVILDCCHAAHIARSNDLWVRAYPHPTYLDIAEHLGMLRALGLPRDQVHPVDNPDVVRLVACASWESAYEYTDKNGQRIGLFTDSLRIALEEAGEARATWATLAQRIRRRVSTLEPSQRPEAEGPSRRLLFELEELRGGTRFTVVRERPDRLSLPGGSMLGLRLGDTLSITPAGEEVADDTTIVATATVTHQDGLGVRATFELRSGHDDLPPVAEAHPLTTSERGNAVVVRGEGELVGQILAAIAAEPTLRALGPADPPEDDPTLAEVRVAETVELWDGGTVPLRTVAADRGGVGRITGDLVRLARLARLRRLTPDPDEELTAAFVVEWGRVVAGRIEPLPPTGSLLHVGEHVYIRLRNASDRHLFFFAFDLGVGGAITPLLTADPGGRRVEPGEEYIVGERDGLISGIELTWPPDTAATDPRPETILVVVTAEPQDLGVLAHGSASTARGSSSLQRSVAAVSGHGPRTRSAGNEPGGRYAVMHLEWQLTAVSAPAEETARFLIDERPDPSLRLLQPRGLGKPRTVAVRLTELVVHSNRSLGGADVRVDALVLTGGDGDLPSLCARTLRFSNVADGDRLPLDNLLVYHGPVVDYLDLAWWVSRDRRNSLALSDLLRERMTADDVQGAIVTMAGLALVAPHAALAAAAASACAVIVSTAYRLLSGVVGNSIGLYRTSLLAYEDFGVGRHPVEGLHRAQDFSFAYEVMAID